MSAKEFVSIRVSTLRGDLQIPFDAYVRINEKHILYCRKGDSFEGERLQRLKSKKLKKMFILNDEENEYRQYLRRNIDMAFDSTSGKPIETRAQVIQGAQQATAEDLMESPESKAMYEVAMEGSKRYIDFILKEDEALKNVIQIDNSDHSVAHHAVNVSTLAISLASRMGYDQSQQGLMNQLAIGCLVHDIEHSSSDLDMAKPLKDFSQEQLLAYKSHPAQGAIRVNNLRHFDEVVVKIIHQHEEKIDGSGFPDGLKEKDMDPVILIASTANAYDRYTSFEGLDHKAALKAMLIDQMGLHPLDVMKSLQDVLKENEVLP